VKLSVSIPDDDVEFIDQYADKHGLESRSAVVQRALDAAIRLHLGL
jgi:metal-responsive CopG/Arc/MetJ family transcriptional regulator